jgi:hypothetical protein
VVARRLPILRLTWLERLMVEIRRDSLPQLFPRPKLLCGVVEGLNNKAEVTMRKSYGFRTYRVLELASTKHSASYRTPESTYDFF